jgi:hypothetical protein
MAMLVELQAQFSLAHMNRKSARNRALILKGEYEKAKAFEKNAFNDEELEAYSRWTAEAYGKFSESVRAKIEAERTYTRIRYSIIELGGTPIYPEVLHGK